MHSRVIGGDDSGPAAAVPAAGAARLRRLSPVPEAAVIGAAIVIAYAVFGLSDVVAVGAYTDDGIYVVLGRALAHGLGYHSTYLAGAPLQERFPPGLPAIYAVLWWIGGSLTAVTHLIRVLDLALCGAAAAMIWWLGRVRFRIAAPLLLVLCIGPFLLDSAIQYYNLALSEPPFLFLWAVALLLLFLKEDGKGTIGIRRAALLGLVMAAAILIRSQAVAIVPGFFVALAARRRSWRAVAAFAVAAILPVALWQLALARMVQAQGPIDLHPREWPYVDVFRLVPPDWIPSFLARTLSFNAAYYWDRLTNYLAAGLPGDVLGAAWVLLFAAGCVRAWRRMKGVVLMVLGCLALVMVWPLPAPRLVLPLLPFAGLLGALALEPRRNAASRRPSLALAVLAGFALTVTARQTTTHRDAVRQFEAGTVLAPAPPAYFLLANTRSIIVASDWILRNTEPSDRILIGNVGAIYLLTGRETMWPEPREELQLTPEPADGVYLARRIARDSITVIFVDNLATHLARDVVALSGVCPDALQSLGPLQVGAIRNAGIFRARPGDACVRAWLAGQAAP